MLSHKCVFMSFCTEPDCRTNGCENMYVCRNLYGKYACVCQNNYKTTSCTNEVIGRYNHIYFLNHSTTLVGMKKEKFSKTILTSEKRIFRIYDSHHKNSQCQKISLAMSKNLNAFSRLKKRPPPSKINFWKQAASE